MANGGHNDYGRCVDSEVWYTREQEANAIGDAFKGIMSSFPIGGSLIAGLVPDTHTANAVRMCPGATIDHTTAYTQEYILMAIVVALIFIYLIAK